MGGRAAPREAPRPEGTHARRRAHIRAAGLRGELYAAARSRASTLINDSKAGNVSDDLNAGDAGSNAASVPGVIFASAMVLAQPTSQPRRVGTTIRLVVTFGPTLYSIADDIRVVLHRYVPTLTGTELVRIDITVVDISQVSD